MHCVGFDGLYIGTGHGHGDDGLEAVESADGLRWPHRREMKHDSYDARPTEKTRISLG